MQPLAPSTREYKANKDTLRSLCLVNKKLLSVAQPMLPEVFALTTKPDHLVVQPFASHRSSGTPQPSRASSHERPVPPVPTVKSLDAILPPFSPGSRPVASQSFSHLAPPPSATPLIRCSAKDISYWTSRRHYLAEIVDTSNNILSLDLPPCFLHPIKSLFFRPAVDNLRTAGQKKGIQIPGSAPVSLVRDSLVSPELWRMIREERAQ
ncbi:hypothetical protein JCM11641_004381 [Rhodosporidiobolus odoratus]